MTVDFEECLWRVRDRVTAVAARDAYPTDPHRGAYVTDDAARTLASGMGSPVVGQRLERAMEALGLDALEARMLVFVLAAQVVPGLGRLYGYLHDDLSRTAASPALLVGFVAGEDVSEDDVLERLGRHATLRRHGAIRVADGDVPLESAITAAPALVAAVLGHDLGGSIGTTLQRIDEPRTPLGRPGLIERIEGLLRLPEGPPLLLVGGDAMLALAKAARRGVVCLGLAECAAGPHTVADLLLAARLEDRVAVVDRLEVPEEDRDAAIASVRAAGGALVLCAEHDGAARTLAGETVVAVDVPVPTTAERADAWSAATGLQDVQRVAGAHRLDVTQIVEAAAIGIRLARAAGEPLADGHLEEAARRSTTRELAEVADVLPPGPGRESLILPPRAQLGLDTLNAFLRHGKTVLGEWGYDRFASTDGIAVLFAGESGTGKTFAARVLATEQRRELFRVDLAGLYSKWIGETEKNLDRIFRAGERSNAILFFDEADVVLGKRSQAQDSNDRYANLGTAYLLQRIESYPGAVVLATNFRNNIDEAFLRRIDLHIDFPPPDETARRLLWETFLPSTAPRGPSVDVSSLAERFELTGGAIRNCCLTAAYLAADDGGPIEMDHLIRAVALEFRKLGRLTVQSDFQGFEHLTS